MPILRFKGCIDEETAEAGERILEVFFAKTHRKNGDWIVELPYYAPYQVIDRLRSDMAVLGLVEIKRNRRDWLQSRMGNRFMNGNNHKNGTAGLGSDD